MTSDPNIQTEALATMPTFQTEAIVPVSDAKETLAKLPSTTDASEDGRLADRFHLELREEKLDVRKIVRQIGEVRIEKRVVEETTHVPVTIRREEITLTRKDISVPLDESDSSAAQVFGEDQTLTFVLHEEVPIVTKTTRAYQQVEISKRLVTQEKTISDAVRREEADITAPDEVRVVDEEQGD